MPDAEKNAAVVGLEERINNWWFGLQKERKCDNTRILSKIVCRSTVEEQERTRQIISNLIKKDVSSSIRSKDVDAMIVICNAVNGCFDNFAHAADAANISFNEIIRFVDVNVDECRNSFTVKNSLKCSSSKLWELLHSLSRILVLILKLRRPQKSETKSPREIDAGARSLLSKLSLKVSAFLVLDEVFMDTKINFVMSSLLIRELMTKDKNKLIQYHGKFLATLPEESQEKEYKLDILKFLLSSGVLNVWSDIVIDARSIATYAQFFVRLCQRYSSDTAVILNISRSLLLLVKNERFAEFACAVADEESDLINSLLSCAWMLVDHPIACVRHSSRDLLQLLATFDVFKRAVLNRLNALTRDKRSYYVTLSAIANECGSRTLIDADEELPRKLLTSVYDPVLVSHVVNAIERLSANDALVEVNFGDWCETWIVPLLVSLSAVPAAVTADIEKLLDVLFRRHPAAVAYIINKWSEPENDEELRCLITGLKVYHKHGLKLEHGGECGDEENRDECLTRKGNKWRHVIRDKLFLACLRHGDDNIRTSAFSVLVEGLKSTEEYSDYDFECIKYFLTYNMNNQSPATRQRILSLASKMLTRFADGLNVIKRKDSTCSKRGEIERYRNFETWLVDFSLDNIFESANFNRINTALSILLLAYDVVPDFAVDCRARGRWKKILVALRSTYEENKIMAVRLARKMNVGAFLTEEGAVEALFKRGYELCGKMEPPNVLTGSYLMQIVTELSPVRKIAEDVLRVAAKEVKLLCLMLLAKKLREQVEAAKGNLVRAAATGPMYGVLFAVRLIMSDVDFARFKTGGVDEKWYSVVSELISLSLDMTRVVSCVVNSSSPEGHLPSDFQCDFKFLSGEGLGSFSGEDLEAPVADDSDEETSSVERRSLAEMEEDAATLIRRFNRAFLMLHFSSCVSKDTVRDLGALLKDSGRVLRELRRARSADSKLADCLETVNRELRNYLRGWSGLEGPPPSAQVLLLCSWRSIKEACLFLGDLVSKLPLDDAIAAGLISSEMVVTIGEELRKLLCEIKHCGAFEQAYVGFVQLATALWKSTRKDLSDLPNKWLSEVIEQIKSPAGNHKVRLCSTRRSAGLPFLVQAIISSEMENSKSAKIQTLHGTMNALLEILESEGAGALVESRVHALNVLRALFKHATFGEHVAPYVSRALAVAVRGSRASAWSERNSCNLLFSTLVTRIFGVARNKDSLSKKNRMTSRTFFQRYPEMYEFFLAEMKLAFEEEEGRKTTDGGYHPQPSAFLILLILARLYPPPMEDATTFDFAEFLPLIDVSSFSPILKVRELGARALVPLISPARLREELASRFGALRREASVVDNNRQHGLLLQLKAVLAEMSFTQPELVRRLLEENGRSWIEDTEWILRGSAKRPYLICHAYAQILHAAHKMAPGLVSVTAVTAKAAEEAAAAADSSANAAPGYFVYVETLSYVAFDAIAGECLASGRGDRLREAFVSMLRSDVNEVQAVPLRILRFVVVANGRWEGIAEEGMDSVAVNVRELSCLQREEDVRRIEGILLAGSDVKSRLIDGFASVMSDVRDSSSFCHKVTTRLWLSLASTLLLRDAISVTDFRGESALDAEAFAALTESGDSDVAASASVFYAAAFFASLSSSGDAEATPEFASRLARLLFAMSDSDADIKQRLIASELFNKYHSFVDHSFFREDPRAFGIWMLPFRLLLDDDSRVRRNAMKILGKCEGRAGGDASTMEVNVVPEGAQEHLMSHYLRLGGNVLNLTLHMFVWSLSALFKSVNYENITGQNEVGVFEKGNPNPFLEEMRFSNFMCEHLKSTNAKRALSATLSPIHVECLRGFFPTLTLAEFPDTLVDLFGVIEEIFAADDPDFDNRTASLLSQQILNLRAALSAESSS